MKKYITPDDLFARVGEILNLPAETPANRLLHETLVLCCQEALRTANTAFGNLFSQVDYLCKQHHIRTADVVAIQKMRRDSNRSTPLSPEDVLYDCRALALFIAAVFNTSVPSLLVGRIPATNKPATQHRHIDYRYVRCIVDDFTQDLIHATADQDGADERPVSILYSAPQLQHLQKILKPGMQLNLINSQQDTDGDTPLLKPELIVVEPDYLIDISSIAACFQSIGHHPLTYTIKRLSPNPNSQALLLGNFAGRVLDDVINSTSPYDWRRTFRAHFRQQAFDYCTCPDLNQKEDFKQAAANQAANIQQIVAQLFPTTATPNSPAASSYSREHAILEPSFLCERLGLQGRVDLMTTDFHLLVEQKSGKNHNIERQMPNEFGSYQKEDHYVQLLLYYGVLLQNFRLSPSNIDARLLYSKYPLPGGLVVVNYYQKLFHEAIALRNRIVATDFFIAKNGFQSILNVLKPETLLKRKSQTAFFERFIKPQTDAVTQPLHNLSPLEKAYVCRMLTFCYREQLAARLGNTQKPGNSIADLWNLPLAEKKELGVIFTGLTITKKEKTDPDHGFDVITLAVPDQGENFLPNFRIGDPVYLYAYPEGETPDARHALLFKATLTEMLTDRLVVVLNDGQSNPNLLVPNSPGSPSASVPASPTSGNGSACAVVTPQHSSQQFSTLPLYALEHSDFGGSSPLKALAAFAAAPSYRRQLLLSIQPPRSEASLSLSRSYNPFYDDIVRRAKQAQDYFLLVGPPGTGKTSMALRFLVEELSQAGSILLTAYTNRAVDEICDMLSNAGLDYLRIGKEYACDVRFRSHMLRQMLDGQPQLSALRQRLDQVSIVVGTTLSLQSQSSLFAMKKFAVAIVDEASQILEPQIVGLLCQVPKFILIGDYKQLPAVVQQSEEESAVGDEQLRALGLTNCRNSLFERLMKRCPDNCVGILRRQGRMHPDIAAWPNQMFYHREQLLPVPLPHQEEPTTDARLRFIPSSLPTGEGRGGALSDKVNPDEARIVAQELKKVYEKYGDRFDAGKTVGVIVPYRNQISMIRREIEQLDIPQLLQISIDTVERYQGSQRDVIIFSTTITRRYQLDFLCANTFEEDGHLIDRKLNVALTRARCYMIITGHEPTLRQSALYASLLDYIRDYNLRSNLSPKETGTAENRLTSP